jgi:AAA15 family ATPase/GTPase
LIEELHLENFRGLADHHVRMRDTTIIVGANNAGKSTVVEALRLIAVATNRLINGKSTSAGRLTGWICRPGRSGSPRR